MGALTKAKLPLPPQQRSQPLAGCASAATILQGSREAPLFAPSWQRQNANLQTQLQQATQFGHHLGQMQLTPAAPPLQRKSLGSTAPLTQPWTAPVLGSGKPLPRPLQRKMEGAFSTHFDDVRVQDSPQAQAIGAAAYTQGNQIYFAPGQYNPDSLAGQTLLGHELTHVVQQRAGQVAIPQGKDGLINADPNLEAEADTLGAKAAQGESVRVSHRPLGGLGNGLMDGGLVAPSMAPPPVQCGLFKKIGKGIKGIGKGIGKGVKGLGKKFVDIAPSLYTFGLDVASAMPGPIGHIGNGVRAIAGLDNSLLSGLIKGEGIESAMEDSVGSFLGGFNMPGMGGMPGMPGMGGGLMGGGMGGLGDLMGGGMPAMAGGPMLGGMPGLGGLESLFGGMGGGNANLLRQLLP